LPSLTFVLCSATPTSLFMIRQNPFAFPLFAESPSGIPIPRLVSLQLTYALSDPFFFFSFTISQRLSSPLFLAPSFELAVFSVKTWPYRHHHASRKTSSFSSREFTSLQRIALYPPSLKYGADNSLFSLLRRLISAILFFFFFFFWRRNVYSIPFCAPPTSRAFSFFLSFTTIVPFLCFNLTSTHVRTPMSPCFFFLFSDYVNPVRFLPFPVFELKQRVTPFFPVSEAS